MPRLRALPCSFYVAAALFVATVAPPAVAQADGWTPVGGPGGGTVTELAVGTGSPGRIWAATLTAGLFQSTNAAASWSQTGGHVTGHQGSGLDLDPSWARGEILTLAADPSLPGSAYASTRTTLLKTEDSGATWHPVGLNGDITSIAVAPSDSDTVYVSDHTAIWRTDNGGATWRRLIPDVDTGAVLHLAVDPDDPRIVYAASTRGVLHSLDGGVHWIVGQGLDFIQMERVVVDPHRPTTIYGAAFGGFWKSLDQGATWTPVGNLGNEDRVAALVADPSAPDTLYAGANLVLGTGPNGGAVYGGAVLRSTDGGATWTSLLETDVIQDLELDPARPSRLYVATGGFGVWKTDDGGATWALSSDGLTATQVNRLAADPHSPGGLYAAVSSRRSDFFFDQVSLGVWKSDDGGAGWRPVNAGLESLEIGYPLPLVRDLVADPETPGLLYLATNRGVFKTLDGGASWQRSDAGSPVRDVFDLALDPADPDTLYAVGTGDSLLLPPAAAKSTDGGATWTPLTGLSGETLTVTVHPEHPATVFIGGAFLWRSDDAGQTWTQAGQTFAGGQRLAVRPGTPDILYAVLSFQLFGSADGGQTLTRIDLATTEPFQTSVFDLVASPRDPTLLYVATNQGVFVLSQPDDVWAPVSDSLEPSWFLSLAVDPFSPERLYAGVRDGLVYTHGQASSECADGPATLCLGGRFQVSVTWENPDGPRLPARALPVTSESGSFWVFDPGSAELVVKVLDGRAVNGRFWVFFATLSNLSYTVRVTDTTTGDFRIYRTTRAVSLADTDAFRDDDGTVGGTFAATVSAPAASPCAGTSAALCLGNRFQVAITWRNDEGKTGAGQAVPLGSNSGAFWFTGPQDLDAAVKVLDGRAVNGHFWVFSASLTTLSYTMRITDLETGAVKTYDKPAGALSSQIDIGAF